MEYYTAWHVIMMGVVPEISGQNTASPFLASFDQ
jgi:hypothetical protein